MFLTGSPLSNYYGIDSLAEGQSFLSGLCMAMVIVCVQGAYRLSEMMERDLQGISDTLN